MSLFSRRDTDREAGSSESESERENAETDGGDGAADASAAAATSTEPAADAAESTETAASAETASAETTETNEVSVESQGDPEVQTDADPASPAIFVEDVALSYGGDPVVETETLVIPEGEVTALVGPNGSGKSTLLKAMSAELTPDRGAVAFDGRAVDQYGTTELARRLGLLSQENTAPKSTTVRELATHGRYPHRGFFEGLSEDDVRAVDRALTRVGVEHLADRRVGDLSGGQKQLAWLAMVLAQETDALLLDEPTTYLDLHHQLRVLQAVRALNEERGVTVAVVLHDIGQAARFADNLVALRDGEPYDWGPPDEVVTEGLIEEVFGVRADVGYGPDGPTVTPREPMDE